MQEPKVGIGVFVVRDGKILLGKRTGSHGTGTWGLAGGHLEFEESFEDCAKREVFEETGLRISGIRFLTATNDVFKETQKHYVTILLMADPVKGQPKLMEPDKFSTWEWFSWDNLPQPLFLPVENLKKSGFVPF